MQLHSSRALRLSLALAALTVVGAASAATLTDSFTIGSSATDWFGNTLKSGSLSRFNPSLGTLTGVQISLSATVLSTVKLANLSQSSTAVITGNVVGDFTMSDQSSANGHVPNIVGSVSKSVTTGTLAVNSKPYGPTDDAVFTSASGQIFQNVTNTGTFSYSAASPSDLSYFLGTSKLGFNIQAFDDSFTQGVTGANGRAVYTTSASALGTVTYTYQPVPEPTSVAALGLGVVGLMRRRKGARK